MHKYSLCFIMAIIMFCTFSCKKEKTSTITPVVTPIDSPIVYDNYTELKPGNYWIYEEYMVDSINGAAHAQGTFDSSYVEKDTTINGNTYHKYLDLNRIISTNYNVYYLRDSLSYTVANGGGILFSSTDFTTIFNTAHVYDPAAGIIDTVTVNTQMGFKDSVIAVGAGTFKTSSLRQIWGFPSPPYHFGPTREYDHSYAKGIGLIKETTGFYSASPQIYEKRLVRYHVQ